MGVVKGCMHIRMSALSFWEGGGWWVMMHVKRSRVQIGGSRNEGMECCELRALRGG
jgi:hypothetical protein